MMVPLRLPQMSRLRLNCAQSICATASAECRRAFCLKHRPIRLPVCDRGTRARGQSHHSPKMQTSRSLSDGASETGNHPAGNECMTYPPMKKKQVLIFRIAGVCFGTTSRAREDGFVHSLSSFLVSRHTPTSYVPHRKIGRMP